MGYVLINSISAMARLDLRICVSFRLLANMIQMTVLLSLQGPGVDVVAVINKKKMEKKKPFLYQIFS